MKKYVAKYEEEFLYCFLEDFVFRKEMFITM